MEATATRPDAADAGVAIARLEALSADFRGCAVVEPGGSVLAASGDSRSWEKPAREFLAAVDAAGDAPAAHAHVATEDGEAFAVRHGDLAMLAVTDRFTLASLVITDMRMALRDLANGEPGRDRRAPERAPAAPEPEGDDDGEIVNPAEGMD